MAGRPLDDRLLQMWNEESERVKPVSAPRSLMQWSSTLTLPDCTAPFDPMSHPAQRAYIEAWDSGLYREFVAIGPTQDGKTVVCVILPLMHELFERRSNAVYGLPSELIAERQWREKMGAIIRLSGMDDMLPSSGTGSRGGGKVRGPILFRNGCLLTWMSGGGTNESSQSSVTARLCCKDEIDDMTPGAVQRMDRRTDAWGDDGRRISATTIKDDVNSLGLSMWEGGTRTRLHHTCPSCGHATHMEWAQIRYDDTSDRAAADTAMWECPGCCKLFSSDEIVGMRKRAVPVSDDDGSLTFSIRWSALDSPLRRGNLPSLCVQHRKARIAELRGDLAPMRQFTRDVLCAQYDAPLSAGEFSTRVVERQSAVSSYARGDRPGWVKHLILTVDHQADRLYHMITGWANDFTMSAIVDWGETYIGTRGTLASDADRIACMRKLSSLAGFVAMGTDVGYQTDCICAFLRSRDGAAWYAVRGEGGDMIGSERTPAGIAHHVRVCRVPGYGLPWVYPRPEIIRHDVHAGIMRREGDSGCMCVPRGISKTADVAEHLSAVLWRDGAEGRRRDGSVQYGARSWVKVHKRDDYLDLAVYARAVASVVHDGMGRTVNRIGKWGTK